MMLCNKFIFKKPVFITGMKKTIFYEKLYKFFLGKFWEILLNFINIRE